MTGETAGYVRVAAQQVRCDNVIDTTNFGSEGVLETVGAFVLTTLCNCDRLRLLQFG